MAELDAFASASPYHLAGDNEVEAVRVYILSNGYLVFGANHPVRHVVVGVASSAEAAAL